MVGVEIQTWLGWERAAALGGRGKGRCSFTQVWEDEEGSCQVRGPSLRWGGSGIRRPQSWVETYMLGCVLYRIPSAPAAPGTQEGHRTHSVSECRVRAGMELRRPDGAKN